MNKKLWFCGMSGPDSLENLQELLGPIHGLFDGIVWVLHDAVGSEEEKYLESIKGEGKIIHYYYNFRHNESRNQYLWCGPIKQGDWVCSCDDLERVPASFAGQIKPLIQDLKDKGYNAAFYFEKPFIFEYHESMRFDGNPHEGLRRNDHGMRAIELSKSLPDEKLVRENVRAQKRQDSFGWCYHYAKYYISCPWGSNHVLLGNEARGNSMDLYHERETLRVDFRNYLLSLSVPLTLDGLKEFFKKPLDKTTKKALNGEKILQDLYRLEVEGDETIVDDHTWPDMKVY